MLLYKKLLLMTFGTNLVITEDADNLLVPFSRVNTGQETSVTNYLSMLGNAAEERRSHLLGGENLKSRTTVVIFQTWNLYS